MCFFSNLSKLPEARTRPNQKSPMSNAPYCARLQRRWQHSMKRLFLAIVFAAGAVFPVLADDHWSPPKDAAKVGYEDFARWPKKYQNHNVMVRGSIWHIEYYNGNDVSFTLSFASSLTFDFAVISWRQPDDFPHLLEGDWIYVWGEFVEMKTRAQDHKPVAVIHAQQIKLAPELGRQEFWGPDGRLRSS